MKEYTVLAVISVVVTVFADRRSGIRLLNRGVYYLFLVIILGFKLLVNGYLTGREIVMYGSRFYLGLRIGSIPVEDFLFGFSMVTLSILFWEYFKRRAAEKHTP